MSRTIAANPTMTEALRARLRAEEAQAAEREAELARAAEVRAGLRASMEVARTRHEEVEEAETGRVTVLARDGLMWLVRKNRITGAMETAALRYRRDYSRAQLTGFGSCVNEPSGGQAPNNIALKVEAMADIERARSRGLVGDPQLIAIMDEVAGKGRTVREIAGEHLERAGMLEAEFRVAARMLARFYGMAS